MAQVKLNMDAYIHKTAHEGRFAKFKSGFSRKRLPKGTVMETTNNMTDMGGMTQVKIVMIDQDLAGISIGGWKEGDIGYVRTAKLQLNSATVREQASLSRPGLNGIGGSVGQWGASGNDLYLDEITLNLNYWSAINDILDLCLAREDNAMAWGPRVKALGVLQILGGATMIGLSLAAVIVTAGAAAPLLVAFGVTAISTGVIGVGTAGAKGKLMQGTGLNGDSSWAPYTEAGKATVVTGTVTAVKKPIINAVVKASVNGQAQQASATVMANAGAGVVGGGFNMYGGSKAIKVANKVNPVAAWHAVDWQEVMTALTNDYITIQNELSGPLMGRDAEETHDIMVKERYFQIAEGALDSLIRKLSHTLRESKNWQRSAASIKTRGALDNW